MDPRTKSLFEQALLLGQRARHEAAKSGGLPNYISPTDGTRLVAAQITATATIFGALIEAEMVTRLRQAQEQTHAG